MEEGDGGAHCSFLSFTDCLLGTAPRSIVHSRDTVRPAATIKRGGRVCAALIRAAIEAPRRKRKGKSHAHRGDAHRAENEVVL